jgi:hypothetical protein
MHRPATSACRSDRCGDGAGARSHYYVHDDRFEGAAWLATETQRPVPALLYGVLLIKATLGCAGPS